MNNKPIYKLTTIVVSLLIVLLNLSNSPTSAAFNPAVTAAELIAGVNQLRQTNGLNTLAANTLLTIAAQSHSEYQASLGYWTHEGPGGTNETDRAYSVGYGNGASIACDEAVAIASSNKDINYIIYDLWNDSVHRDIVLLNNRYLEIGAGVAEGSDGLYYYTVDLCVIAGQTSADVGESTLPASAATQDPKVTATYAPIATQAPREDGSIWHTVRLGETVFDVAFAYGISELELETMNGISPTYPIIYEGQELLIKGAPTPTAEPTNTNTPEPPTRTPKPTFTPSPTRPTATASVTPTITPTPTQPPAILVALENVERRQWGLIIIAVSVLGLFSLLIFNPNKQQKNTTQDEEVQKSISEEENQNLTDPENEDSLSDDLPT